MTGRTRRAVLPLLLVPALALGACSSPEPEATPTPTPTPTGLTAAAWADAVCSSLGDLETDITAITEGLSVELGSGDALDQLTTQLRANVATAGDSLDELTAAIGDAPETEESQDLRDTLRLGADDVTTATQDARDAASSAADATTVAEFLGSAGAALTATSSALTAARQFGTTVKTSAADAGDTLRTAFDESDSCAALSAD